MSNQQKIQIPIEQIDHFIMKWDSFVVDYWWRKRYNIPFGSKQHREMSFIDMAIEYREQLIFVNSQKDEEEVKTPDENENIVHMTDKEIDEDYENLDLSNFN